MQGAKHNMTIAVIYSTDTGMLSVTNTENVTIEIHTDEIQLVMKLAVIRVIAVSAVREEVLRSA